MTNLEKPNLAQLIAKPLAVPVGTCELSIAPMGWYQAGVAMQHLLPVLSAMPAVGAELGDKREDRVALWAGVVVTHRDEIAAFCAESSGLTLDEVKGLQPIHMIELVMGLVEVNADLFVRSMPDMVGRAAGWMSRLMERMAPLGGGVESTLPEGASVQ